MASAVASVVASACLLCPVRFCLPLLVALLCTAVLGDRPWLLRVMLLGLPPVLAPCFQGLRCLLVPCLQSWPVLLLLAGPWRILLLLLVLCTCGAGSPWQPQRVGIARCQDHGPAACSCGSSSSLLLHRPCLQLRLLSEPLPLLLQLLLLLLLLLALAVQHLLRCLVGQRRGSALPRCCCCRVRWLCLDDAVGWLGRGGRLALLRPTAGSMCLL